MSFEFLFLDDSYNESTKYSSLTGIFIPLEKFELIRNDFYTKILNQFIILEKSFNVHPPIIHAKELLKGTRFENNDEKKIEIFRAAKDIVNDNSIQITRVCWSKKSDVSLFNNMDDKLMKLIFPKFLELVDKHLQNNKIIPIMDGLDTRVSKIFSKFMRTLDISGRIINENSLTIKNSNNIYGEVFYANSKFSIFTQLVDLVSYMLHCIDYKKFEKNYGGVKIKIIDTAEKIKTDLITEKYYITKHNAR
jgi:hypothetical protein